MSNKNGIYLNDIPLDIFLDYFDKTNSAEYTENEMVFEESTNIFLIPNIVKQIPLSNGMIITKENKEYVYKNNLFYEVLKLTDGMTINEQPDYIYDSTKSPAGFYNGDTKLELNNGMTIDSYIYDQDLKLFRKTETSSIEGDKITYSGFSDWKLDTTNFILKRRIIEENKTNSNNPVYFEFKNSSINKLSEVDNEDDLGINISGKEQETINLLKEDKKDLTDEEQKTISSKLNALKEYQKSIDTILKGFNLKRTFLSNYKRTFFLNSDDPDNKILTIKIAPNKYKVPKVNENGEHIYKDKNGFLTTKPNTKNNFYQHQRAVRRTFNNLTSNMGWIYRTSPMKVVMVSEKNKEYFAYYDEIIKKEKIEQIETDEVTTGANIASDIIPKNLIGSTKSEAIKIERRIVSLDEIPQYNIFSNIDDYNSLGINSNIFSDKIIKNEEHNAILNIFTRSTNLYGLSNKIKINNNGNIDVKVISTLKTIRRNNTKPAIKPTIKYSNFNNSVDVITSTNNLLGPTNLIDDDIAIKDIDSENPYLLISAFNNRESLFSHIGQEITIILGDTLEITGSIIGQTTNAASIKFDFGENSYYNDIVSIVTNTDLGIENAASANYFYLQIKLNPIEEVLHRKLLCKVNGLKITGTFDLSDFIKDEFDVSSKDNLYKKLKQRFPNINGNLEEEYFYENYYTLNKYIKKTVSYEIKGLTITGDTVSRNDISVLNLNNIIDINIPNLKNNTIQKLYKSSGLYFDDEYSKLRGEYIPDNVFFNKRKSALFNFFTDFLKRESEEPNLAIETLKLDGLVRVYNYSKGIEYFTKNDTKKKKNYLIRTLNNIEDSTTKIILNEKNYTNSLIEQEELDSGYKTSTLSLIERITNYKKYPTTAIYERQLNSVNPFDISNGIIENNVNLKNITTNVIQQTHINNYYNTSIESLKNIIIKEILNFIQNPKSISRENLTIGSSSYNISYKNKLNNTKDTEIEPINTITNKKLYDLKYGNISDIIEDLFLKHETNKLWEVING